MATWVTLQSPQGVIERWCINGDKATRDAVLKGLKPDYEVVKEENLPYPASPQLGPADWPLCYQPEKCAGKTSCPCPYGRSCAD